MDSSCYRQVYQVPGPGASLPGKEATEEHRADDQGRPYKETFGAVPPGCRATRAEEYLDVRRKSLVGRQGRRKGGGYSAFGPGVVALYGWRSIIRLFIFISCYNNYHYFYRYS